MEPEARAVKKPGGAVKPDSDAKLSTVSKPDPAGAASDSEEDGNADLIAIEALKAKGNKAFQMARVLRGTTAGKQYVNDAQCDYVDALQRLGYAPPTEPMLKLGCMLHANLAAVFLLSAPPRYSEAKAACDVALSLNGGHVKAMYRRAQALLEDNREGLPESALRAALEDLESVRKIEPNNAEALAEMKRVSRRIADIEARRMVPDRRQTATKIAEPLLNRGGDCLDSRGYVWGQSQTVVHIFVLAQGVRLVGQAVVCKFRTDSLHVELPSPSPSFEGKLCKPVRPDDCCWQLEDDGLILHLELAKRPDCTGGEHWSYVCAGHPETNAPSHEEQQKVEEVLHAAQVHEAEQKAKPKDPKREKVLDGLRQACPGVDVEWGDTSLAGLSD
eukprot:NODE_7765_length_1552_cov_4.928421.p1 GENE.NODE_7765_length_1552_cov_4.928421~~NODE_7765_length_1552_cov_4.928421.p1  ORF type:complete len:388 (-),score=73.35 NODE_7765_length_1552_cov_4.928421:304-1467(-)